MVSTSKPKSELIKLKSLNKRKLTSKDKEQQQEGTTTRRRRWEHDASVIKEKKNKKLKESKTSYTRSKDPYGSVIWIDFC